VATEMRDKRASIRSTAVTAANRIKHAAADHAAHVIDAGLLARALVRSIVVHRAVSPQAMGGSTQQGGPGTWIRAHAVTPSARSLSRENGVGRVGFSGRDGMDG